MMEDKINFDDSLNMIKNTLNKEYFILKNKIQMENIDCNLNLNNDPVYDLVDKQYLFIQELFKKYNDLLAELSFRKMIIENKSRVLKEVHPIILNRLLEKNYQQENQIQNSTKEIIDLKKTNQKLIDENNEKSQLITKLLTKEPNLVVNKTKAINVYNYNQKSKRVSSASSLNTTSTSNSKLTNDKVNSGKVVNDYIKNIAKLNNSRLSCHNSIPSSRKKAK